MRLIDADELKRKLKLWAFNNVTTTSPTFDFVTEFDIDECPTVDVLEQIRAEIADLPIRPEYQQTEHEKGFIDATNRALQIIDKYTKGDKE